MKECRKCKIKKDESEFYKQKDRKDGLSSYCKMCVISAERQWRKNNTEKSRQGVRQWRKKNPIKIKKYQDTYRKKRAVRNPKHNYEYHIMHTYGLSKEDIEKLLQIQDNKCAICNTTFKKFLIDHDHTTNQVRGLLCTKCNTLIGFADESPKILLNAIEYLNGICPIHLLNQEDDKD